MDREIEFSRPFAAQSLLYPVNFFFQLLQFLHDFIVIICCHGINENAIDKTHADNPAGKEKE